MRTIPPCFAEAREASSICARAETAGRCRLRFLQRHAGLRWLAGLVLLTTPCAALAGPVGGRQTPGQGASEERRSIVVRDKKPPEETQKPGGSGSKYAVIVGVNDYADRAPHLRYAVSDARRIYDTLTNPRVGGQPADHVILLTSDATEADLTPTLPHILHALQTQTQKARKNDQFWFYFAGHGLEAHQLSYLLPQDFACASLDKTALSTHALRDLLDKECKASQKVIILDACQSGSARGLDAAPSVQQTFNGTGMVTFTACSVNESAWEMPRFPDGSGGGVFTYYLVGGLRKYADANRDGIICVPEIRDYVRSRVTQELQSLQHVTQTPQFIAEHSSNLSRVYLTRVADGAPPDNPPDVDAMPLQAKEPLPPALLVLLNGVGGQGGPGNAVENEVIARLIKRGFLIADPQAAGVLHSLVGDTQIAQAAGRRGARFLVMGQYNVSANSPVPPFVTVIVSISARLVDEKGTTLATAKGVSGPHAGSAEASAEADAIEEAAERFVDNLATSGIAKALGLDKPQP